ncbi:MAG: trehalase family glycosidase [Bdellovibrionota bacterium]
MHTLNLFVLFWLVCSATVLRAGNVPNAFCAVQLESAARLKSTGWFERVATVEAHIGKLKAHVVYPDIPSVEALHLPTEAPKRLLATPELSPGLVHPLIEEGRRTKAFQDFKFLSDARVRDFSGVDQIEQALAVARSQGHPFPVIGDSLGHRAYIRSLIEGLYTFESELVPALGYAPKKWALQTDDRSLASAFAYTEDSLQGLVRWTHQHAGSSALEAPYPVLIPSAGRFHEAYYWDTFWGVQWLLRTGRNELARMQVENLLSLVQRFGFIPNGMRDYYLSRSQPPFLTSVVRAVLKADGLNNRSRDWLRRRAYPLMVRDYQNFWMNPETRFDAATGLNHHWDAFNWEREERYGEDNELVLGRTYRDTRSEAEAGTDFSDSFEGEASNVAGSILNSMLYQTEIDLAFFAERLGNTADARKFKKAAELRKTRMQRLWSEKGYFQNWNLRTGKTIDQLTAETFFPLMAGVATREQARQVMQILPRLEREGGIMASEIHNPAKQWTGRNAWAVYFYAAACGARRYGFNEEAERLARKWAAMTARVHERRGAMFERMDVVSLDIPDERENHKYPTERGFLWTNAAFVWALMDVLGYRLDALPE